MNRGPYTLGVALASVFLAVTVAGQPVATYDLLIRNGRVLDGTGNPWFPADVAVKDGRIVAVGQVGSAQTATVIDAAGKYVTPGFIDIHSHADDGASPEGGLRDPNRARRAAPNLVSQGITTVVVNQDGRSPWPIRDQRALLEKQGIGVNAMMLVGHGTVRRMAMKDDVKRPSSAAEQTRMRELLRQGLQEGAVGWSAGLEYEPGRWSTTDEVVELARELPAAEGIYISHERSEGSDPLWYVPSQDGPGPPTLLDAVRETIEIGEKSGARVRGLAPEGEGRALLGIERGRGRPHPARPRPRGRHLERSVSLSDERHGRVDGADPGVGAS